MGTDVVALDILALTRAEQITAVYIAYFGRAPDPLGLSFWIGEYDGAIAAGQTAKQALSNIASSFAVDAEAKATYPFLTAPLTADPSDFVVSIFDNLYNRPPDDEGLAFWVGEVETRIAAGEFVGTVIVDIISGAQDTEAGLDIATILNKIDAGWFYATEYVNQGAAWTLDDDIAGARDVVRMVTSDPASLAAAKTQASAIVAEDLVTEAAGGAIPAATTFSPTGTIIDFVLNGTRWDLDSTRTITWALADSEDFFFGETENFWRDWGQVNIFDQIAQFIDVSFEYVGHFNNFTASTANLTVTPLSQFTFATLLGDPDILGLAIFPNEMFAATLRDGLGITASGYPTPEGDVFISADHPAHSFINPGANLVQTVIHEVLHALGLKHPFDDGASDTLGGAVFPSVASASPGEVGTSFTIMDYDEANPFWPFGEPATPMMLDVAALQFLYGANEATGLGDDIYALSNDGRVRTVWDVAGNDTFDASSNFFGVTIDLEPGALSTISADTKVGIAFSTEIENAIGGAGHDLIIGNDLDNVFLGGEGDDDIFGGSGIDTAVYSGTRAEYTIIPTTDGVFVQDLLFIDGIDFLSEIEFVGFSDGTFALDLLA